MTGSSHEAKRMAVWVLAEALVLALLALAAYSASSYAGDDADALPEGLRRGEDGALRWEGDGAVMCAVPAGKFRMGAPSDFEWEDREAAPQHEAEVDAFYIDRDEVTVARYRAFLAAIEKDGHGACHPEEPKDKDHAPLGFGTERYAAYGGTDAHPVCGVDWYDAWAYAAWAGKRLPTEAEWEKAARGTDARLFPWGDDWPKEMGPYGNAQKVKDQLRGNWRGDVDGHDLLAPVGSFPAGASPYGCLDMAGNVWEWVDGWFAIYPGGSKRLADEMAMKGPQRVIRGGSWSFGTQDVQVTHRHWHPSRYRSPDVGFRCAVSSKKKDGGAGD